MSVSINNFLNNDNIVPVDSIGSFTVLEYRKDMSVDPGAASSAWFASQMNIRSRQLLAQLDGNVGIITQSGAMQWTSGSIESSIGVKSAGGLAKKLISGKMTGESAIKPEYKGKGVLVLEPTYKHILLEDISAWDGGIVLEDGMFLACESTLSQKVIARSSFTSAVAGGEGLFNLSLTGYGIAALESRYPRQELIEIELENDILKIDGNYAVAWSAALLFTVERSGKSLIGSAVNGEGLVNVYRGTGKVLMAPVR